MIKIDEKLENEIYKDLENGYNEELLYGEYADSKTRHTKIIVKRTTQKFVLLFACDTFWNGEEVEYTLEELTDFKRR